MKSLLLNLRERLEKKKDKIESFCIDNCCQWRSLLKGIFGEDIQVKLDLFHAVQRISSQIPKNHPYRKHCVAALRLIFRQPDDLEIDRKKETPCPSEIMQTMELFKKQWGNVAHNGVKVLNKKAHDEIEKLKKHISKGCLSFIPVGGGTNRNENLHKNLKKNLSKSRVGVQTAIAQLGTFFYVWNERMLQRNTKSSVVRPISAYESDFIKEKVEKTKEVFGTGVSLREIVTKFGYNNEQFSEACDQNTFNGFPEYATVQESDSEDDNYNAENNGSSALFSSTQCQSAIQMAMTLKRVYETLSSQCKAQSIVNPRRIHLFRKGFMSCVPRNGYENIQPRDGEIQLNGGLLEAYGMNKVSIPADGDCFFSSVSFHLSQILKSEKNTDFAKRLETLGLSVSSSQKEIVQTLRRLVVDEWLGQRRNVYEPFVTLSGLSYELQAREFLNAGHFDSEIGNAMVLAVSNILQVPFIIFTTMENLPVISSIPTTESFYEMPLYLAFTHIGAGHYDVVVLQDSSMIKENQVEGKNNSLQQTLLHKSEQVSCRCGQGRSGKMNKSKEVCNNYASGCKCFRTIQACKNCGCNGCSNPYGKNIKDEVIEFGPSARKRRKHSIQLQKQTDLEYMNAKREEIQKLSWSTFEMFLLEIVIDMLQETSKPEEPSLDQIEPSFNEISAFSGLTSNEVLINRKTLGQISKLVKIVENETALFKHMLFGELDES